MKILYQKLILEFESKEEDLHQAKKATNIEAKHPAIPNVVKISGACLTVKLSNLFKEYRTNPIISIEQITNKNK